AHAGRAQRVPGAAARAGERLRDPLRGGGGLAQHRRRRAGGRGAGRSGAARARPILSAREVPELDARTVREWGERYSNWGRWGDDDERGTLTSITPERVLAACALPRTGRVISCALPFDARGPQSGLGGRHNPIHTMLATGADAHAGAQSFLPGGFNYADDAVT